MANPWDNDPDVELAPWANDPDVAAPAAVAVDPMAAVPAFLRPIAQPAAAGPYAANPTVPVAAPVKPVQPWDADPEVELPNRSAGDWANDIGTSVGKGAYGLFDSVAGLGDLLSGGNVTPWLASHGMDSKAARAELDAKLSPQAKQQAAEVANADGFLDTAKAMAMNPAYTAGMAIETLGPMAAGGAVGSGARLGAATLGIGARGAAAVGTGVGEGLLSAGQQAAQTVQQTGDLTAEQAALALGSGALTGAIGAGAGQFAARLGFGDIDARLAGIVGPASNRGMPARVAGGLMSEGGEETLQSAQEQAAQNLALGNPVGQGVMNAAAQGGVLGGLMGGAAGVRPNLPAAPVPENAYEGLQAVTALQTPQQQPAAAGLQAQILAGVGQPVVPFAKSADINPTLDTMNLTPEQKVQAVAMLQPAESSIEEARRGIVPVAEQQRLASLLGKDVSEIAKTRKAGDAWNAETMMAVTNATAAKFTGILDLQQKIATGQATDIEKAQFISDAADYTNMSRSLLGATAEAGRALAAKRRSNYNHAEAQRILEGVAGVNSAEEMAAALGKAMQAGGIQNATKLLADAKPGFFNYYLKAALLSNPQTHVVNAVSNAFMLPNSAIERGIAAAISKAKGAVGLRNETYMFEPVDMLFGMATNFGSASRAALNTFQTMESPVLGTNSANENQSVTPKGNLEQVASVPFRIMSSTDALFAQMNYAAELRALARSQAYIDKQRGLLNGKKISERIAELVATPTPKMIEQAGLHARDNTFNSKAGAFVQGINVAKKKLPWLNVIVPFLRTPANIIKSATRRTPLAPILSDVREDLAAGGRKGDQALARIVWGTSIMMGAGMLANAGYLTGSGAGMDDEEKRAKLATGWKPWSLKIDGQYYSYQRWEPFATVLGMAADIATMKYTKDNEDSFQKAERLAKEAMGIFAANVTNKSFLQGATDFGEFMTDPDRNAEWYAQKMGATLTQPISLLAGIAANNDPYMRKTDSFVDAWKYKVPGLRETLPVQIDQFGRPVRNVERAGIEMLNPVAQSTENMNPVRQEAARLKWAPSKPGDKFTIAKREVQMSAQQYQEFAELSGIETYNLASRVMQSSAYQNASDDARRKIMDKMTDLARNVTKAAMARAVLTGDRTSLDKLRNQLKPTDTEKRP